jgi:hypothetical protein
MGLWVNGYICIQGVRMIIDAKNFLSKLDVFALHPPCVYFVLEGDEVIYVGKSRNINFRIANRWKNNKVLILKLGETNFGCRTGELSQVEGTFIRLFSPKWNGVRDWNTRELLKRRNPLCAMGDSKKDEEVLRHYGFGKNLRCNCEDRKG